MAISLLYFVVFIYGGYTTFGQPTTMCGWGCSYTTLVPKQNSESCSFGSMNGGYNNVEEMVKLKSTIRSLEDQVQQLSQAVQQLQAKPEEQKQRLLDNNNNGSVGTNYVRWGRISCPETAELIYTG